MGSSVLSSLQFILKIAIGTVMKQRSQNSRSFVHVPQRARFVPHERRNVRDDSRARAVYSGCQGRIRAPQRREKPQIFVRIILSLKCGFFFTCTELQLAKAEFI